MKSHIRITLALLFASIHSTAIAASWVVWPGESLQAAINAAAPGDNITVQSGSYGESITINKGLDIRAADGVASFTGTLTITNPTLPVYLADLYFGGISGTGATVTGANTDLRMDRCAIQEGSSFSMTAGKLYLYKSNLSGSVTFNNVDWTSQRCQFSGTVTSNNGAIGRFIASTAHTFTHNGKDLTIFQSTVSEKTTIVAASQSKAWVAYSTFRYMEMTGACEIVGNHFNMRSPNQQVITSDFPQTNCLILDPTGGMQFVRNNVLFGAEGVVLGASYSSRTLRLTLSFYSFPAIMVNDSPGTCTISNNSIYSFRTGIFVRGELANVSCTSNYHEYRKADWYVNIDFAGRFDNYWGNYEWDVEHVSSSDVGKISDFSIKCDNSQAIIKNNITSHGVIGGIATENTKTTLPFLNTTTPSSTNFFRFPADSAAIDAGPDMAIYTDLDGSRNDVGAYGGHSYDPTGRTTTKPVVLSGSVDPLYVKRGGSVTIEARAAVVAEP